MAAQEHAKALEAERAALEEAKAMSVELVRGLCSGSGHPSVMLDVSVAVAVCT